MKIDLDRQPTAEQAKALARYYSRQPAGYEILGFVHMLHEGDLLGGWCPVTRDNKRGLTLIQRYTGNGRSIYDGYYNFIAPKEIYDSIMEARAHRSRIEVAKRMVEVIEV